MAGRGAAKGHPKWGGRKKGTPNKKDVIMQERIAAAKMTPLEYMLHVMETSGDERMKFEAAKAAAPYVHAKPTEKPQAETTGNTTIIVGEITDEQRLLALNAILARGKGPA